MRCCLFGKLRPRTPGNIRRLRFPLLAVHTKSRPTMREKKVHWRRDNNTACGADRIENQSRQVTATRNPLTVTCLHYRKEHAKLARILQRLRKRSLRE